jgi:broad specificity phosphatase PhoE
MNDFSQIRVQPGKQFDTETWLELHWKDRKAILAELSKPFDGPTLVMTHHMPVRAMIHPLRELGATERWMTNAGFASDMTWQLKDYDIDCWVCGHSHDNRTATVEGLHKPFPIISNARGYPKEGAKFKPSMVIETPSLSEKQDDQ